MEGQLLPYKPGEYINESKLGKELTFDEISLEVGKLIAIDCSTKNRAWYKVVLVETIHFYANGMCRLIYYDGKRQRGLVDERYFDKKNKHPYRAWGLN